MSTTPNEDIRKAIDSLFAGNYSATTLVFGNESHTVEVSSTPWARLSYLPAQARRRTITGTTGAGAQHRGIISVQVFTPEDKGEGDMNRILDTIYALISEKTITADNGEITTGISTPSAGLNANGWFQKNLDTPFEYNVAQ